MATLTLPGGFTAQVDNEDLAAVHAVGPWRVRKARGKLYARRNVYHMGKRTTEDLHRFVMPVPKGFVVDHKNSDGLDCRKQNLQRATQPENVGPLSRRHGKRASITASEPLLVKQLREVRAAIPKHEDLNEAAHEVFVAHGGNDNRWTESELYNALRDETNSTFLSFIYGDQRAKVVDAALAKQLAQAVQ